MKIATRWPDLHQRRVVRLCLLIFALVVAPAACADKADVAATALDMTASPTTRAALAAAEPVRARHAMVVTAQHLATRVGVNILQQGGNAVDAAVAVGYALAVVHPCCGNIGGGGFMLIRLAGDDHHKARTRFLDFRETAPARATPTLFQDAHGDVVKGRSTKTYLGIGVPGTVKGLEQARQRYGTMSRQHLMQPAIKLARDGFTLRQGDINILHTRTRDFAGHANVASIFLDHGQPYRVGDTLKQPELAHTLSLIARHGPEAFYRGPIAHAVVAASKAHGGILSMQDFADYTAPWGTPVTCRYHGYTVLSTPPPSSGGTTICEILGMLAPYPLTKWGYGSVQATHYLIEAERRAFADRNTYLGDPAFVHNPIARLLAPTHLAALRRTIQPDRATPSSHIHGSLGGPEGRHTTQFSIVDAQGNAVSVTYTINYLFGTGLIAGHTGFFLNNEMDDFTAKPGVPNAFGLVQGQANRIEPGKRPLSSMSPSIVLHDGRLFMVTGSPGGATIISTTLESMLNVIDFGMNMQQAVDAPRLHMQWLPDVTRIEPGLLTPQVRKRLQSMGHHFKTVRSWGAAEAVLRDPHSGLLQGANDRRRPAGLAAGY